MNGYGPRLITTIAAAIHGAHVPPIAAHARYATPDAIMIRDAANVLNHTVTGSSASNFDAIAQSACRMFVW